MAITLMAVTTIIFGNIAALTQHNVKRLIGLSGVSHAGFLLIGVIAGLRIEIDSDDGDPVIAAAHERHLVAAPAHRHSG